MRWYEVISIAIILLFVAAVFTGAYLVYETKQRAELEIVLLDRENKIADLGASIQELTLGLGRAERIVALEVYRISEEIEAIEEVNKYAVCIEKVGNCFRVDSISK